MQTASKSLHDYLEELNDEYGGDVGFIPVIKDEIIGSFEKYINWELPGIFRYFLSSESNGIAIGNKRIFGLLDSQQKKPLLIIWKGTITLLKAFGSKVDHIYLMTIW